MATTSYFHGVRATQVQVTHETEYECASGIPFVVGTAPFGPVNYPTLVASWTDAIEQFGYSDDWESYTLCEFMKSHFYNYGAQPAILVNVLDSSTYYTAVDAAEYAVTYHQVELPGNALSDSIAVTDSTGSTTYTLDTDYTVYYDDEGSCIVELLSDSDAYSASSIMISYNVADASSITYQDIIGGKDADTRETTGFGILDYVYHVTGVVPDILLAPMWSENVEVALTMAAKAEDINCVFRGIAIADIPTDTVTDYEDLEAYKDDNGLDDPNLILCWPKVNYNDEVYHLSTVMAGTIAITDLSEDSIPCASPSNRDACIDSLVVGDEELLLNIDEASYINSLGIVTALKMPADCYVIYGPHTAGWPEYSDPQNSDIAGNRMFDYICNNLIIKTWKKLDRRLTNRLITGIVESMNTWLQGMAPSDILGAEVKFLASENTVDNLNSGIVTYHVYLGTAPTMRDVEYIVEQDLSYLEALIEELAS